MQFRETTNTRTKRRFYYVVDESRNRLVRVSRSAYSELDRGGRFNSSVTWTDGELRHHSHAR